MPKSETSDEAFKAVAAALDEAAAVKASRGLAIKARLDRLSVENPHSQAGAHIGALIAGAAHAATELKLQIEQIARLLPPEDAAVPVLRAIASELA